MKKLIFLFMIFFYFAFSNKNDTIIISKEKLNEKIEIENKINEYFNYVKLSLNANIIAKETEEKEKENLKNFFLPGFEKVEFSNKKINDIDINVKNSKGETALIIAIENRNNEYLKYLLSKNVNLDVKHPILGKYPIHTAIYFENMEALKMLIEYDKKMVNYQNDIDGWTPLEEATLKGNSEMVKLLLENCANPLLKDKKGNTALDMAVNFGKGEIVKLIRNKIKENRKNGGKLCLN